MKITVRDIEKGFVIFTLILLTDALSFRSLYVLSEGSIDDGSTISPFDSYVAVAQYIIFAVTISLLIVCWKRVIRVALNNIFVPAFVCFVLISTHWSDFPEVTQRSSLIFFSTTLFGIYLATRFSLEEQLRLVAVSLGVLTVISLVLCLTLPGSAIESSSLRQGSWRGPFYNKNNLGLFMYVGATALLLTSLIRQKYCLISWILCGLAFSLIVLANAKTSLVIFLILMTLIPFCYALRWSAVRLIPFFIVAVVGLGSLVTWFVSDSEFILSALGKDSSLSGRTDIWNAVFTSILERPWFGYGYEAFWVADGLKCLGECSYVRSAIHFNATSAHNGYLDLTVGLGYIGLSLFMMSLLIVYKQSIVWVRITSTPEGFWPLLFITSVVLFTQTESALINNRSFLWAIYVATALSLRRQTIRSKFSTV